MSTYIVKPGESLWDVVLNATGTFANLDAVLSANGFTDWTPMLRAGQIIMIPDTVIIDSNTLRQLKVYPACNNSVNDVCAKIVSIFGLLKDAWILSTGLWNDAQTWKDTKTWID